MGILKDITWYDLANPSKHHTSWGREGREERRWLHISSRSPTFPTKLQTFEYIFLACILRFQKSKLICHILK